VLISLLLALAVTLAPLSVATTGQSEGQSPGRDHANPPAVAGEFLVAASPESAAAAGLTVVGKAGFGWTLVKKPSTSGATAAEAADQIAAITDFAVEPNYIYELAEEPLFSDQWSLENTGQSKGKVDADIDILAAWSVTTGSPGVTIAVLDTGVAFSHPDLSSSVWLNSGEVPGNNADDDGNGYVDDIRGWDAVDNDADPSDTHGHGTFVSTTAVAPRNGVGMAGVAPDSVVMPIRVCGSEGCPHSAILTGLEYAIDNGADVINLSFGGYGKSTAMEKAVRDAVAAGIVVVAAAGNHGLDTDTYPFYPASYNIDGLISVGASDHNDALASFSNYGAKSVDLVAPGQSVIGGTLSNSWGTGSGTSFAAPKVAGVVALIKAAKPTFDPVQVANLLSGSVDVLSNLSGKVASGGRLNAGSAVAKPTNLIIEPGKQIALDDNNDEMFFYRNDGLFRFYDVRADGSMPKPLLGGSDYTKGWSSITSVDLEGDGQDEMFFYRDDGLFRYYNVRADGSLPQPLSAGDGYTKGWSSITAVDLDGDGQDEMFFYRDDGLFRYYDVRADGSLGSPLLAGSNYTAGWSSITAVDLDGDGQDEMFFYRDDGLFRFYNIGAGGHIGSPVLAGDGYTKGWSSITAVDLDGDGQDEMFFYRDDGLFRFYNVRADGSLGSPILAGDGYTTGWDTITSIDLNG